MYLLSACVRFEKCSAKYYFTQIVMASVVLLTYESVILEYHQEVPDFNTSLKFRICCEMRKYK